MDLLGTTWRWPYPPAALQLTGPGNPMSPLGEAVRPRCLSTSPKRRSGGALVLVDQAAEDVAAPDRSDMALLGTRDRQLEP